MGKKIRHCTIKSKFYSTTFAKHLSENRSESHRADQSQNVCPVRSYKTLPGHFSRGYSWLEAKRKNTSEE